MFSAGLIWKGAVLDDDDDDDDDDSLEPPEFHNSGYWADWITMVEQEGHTQEVRDAGGGALMVYYCQGMAEDAVGWVTPTELIAAADRLTMLIRAGDSAVATAVNDYLNVGQYIDSDGELQYPRPTTEDLLRDLEVVKTMARWAQEGGKTELAFEIG